MTCRICFISLSSYGYFNDDAPFGGGAQRQLYLLSQELKKTLEVGFIVGDYGQSAVEKRDGITLYKSYKPDTQVGNIRNIIHLIKLISAIRRSDADIYVFRGNPKKAALLYHLVSFFRSKWTYNIANDANLEARADSLSFPLRYLFKRSVANANAVIAQTQYQKSILESKFNRESTVVPNGYPVANDVLSYEDREGILWVGRFDQDQKRPHLFLDLAEQHPDQEFRLIGGGIDSTSTYTQYIQKRATSLSNVTFIGTVPPDEIHEEYRKAIALVNTSSYEGFPNTFLEAWRYGTPVLSLAVNTGRYLKGRSIGFSSGDIDKLSQYIHEMVNDISKREKFGMRGRQIFEETYTISQTSKQYEQVLLSV